MALCTAVTLVERLDNVDVMKVTIDDGEYFWFYKYEDALKYVNEEVIFTHRSDLYGGVIVDAINTLVVPSVVNVIDSHETFRLYSDLEDNQSNIVFSEIGLNDSRDGCIVYCTKCTYNASASSDWLELVIRDRAFRTNKLRIFSPDNVPKNLEGRYCMATLRRTNYGLQSDLIVPTSTEVRPNPEISIAKEFVTKFFDNDVAGNDYINNSNLLNAFDEHFDYEKGYGVVRLAMELCLCDQLRNITKDVDVDTLCHSILASYGFVTVPNLVTSPESSNVIVAIRHKWPNLKLLLNIIDVGNVEKCSMERDIYKRIKDMVDSIIVSHKTYKL